MYSLIYKVIKIKEVPVGGLNKRDKNGKRNTNKLKYLRR